jgi:hypothetical protein
VEIKRTHPSQGTRQRKSSFFRDKRRQETRPVPEAHDLLSPGCHFLSGLKIVEDSER